MRTDAALPVPRELGEPGSPCSCQPSTRSVPPFGRLGLDRLIGERELVIIKVADRCGQPFPPRFLVARRLGGHAAGVAIAANRRSERRPIGASCRRTPIYQDFRFTLCVAEWFDWVRSDRHLGTYFRDPSSVAVLASASLVHSLLKLGFQFDITDAHHLVAGDTVRCEEIVEFAGQESVFDVAAYEVLPAFRGEHRLKFVAGFRESEIVHGQREAVHEFAVLVPGGDVSFGGHLLVSFRVGHPHRDRLIIGFAVLHDPSGHPNFDSGQLVLAGVGTAAFRDAGLVVGDSLEYSDVVPPAVVAYVGGHPSGQPVDVPAVRDIHLAACSWLWDFVPLVGVAARVDPREYRAAGDDDPRRVDRRHSDCGELGLPVGEFERFDVAIVDCEHVGATQYWGGQIEHLETWSEGPDPITAGAINVLGG